MDIGAIFTHFRLSRGSYETILPVKNATQADPFIVKSVDGLGPPEVIVSIVNGKYQGQTPQDKELVIRIGLNPDYSSGATPSGLRNQLYKYITPNEVPTKFEIMSGETTLVEIYGYMKKLEIVPFNKEPEVQFSFDCLGSYLLAPTETEYTFPADSASIFVPNPGADTGFEIEMEFPFPGSEGFAIELNSTGETMGLGNIDFAGSRFIIDTREGQRRAAQLFIAEGEPTEEQNSLHLFFGTFLTLPEAGDTLNFIADVPSLAKVRFKHRYWGV